MCYLSHIFCCNTSIEEGISYDRTVDPYSAAENRFWINQGTFPAAKGPTPWVKGLNLVWMGAGGGRLLKYV